MSVDVVQQARDSVAQAQKKISETAGRRSALEKQQAAAESRLEQLQLLEDELGKAQMLLNSLGEDKQAEAQEMIERLVTDGLQMIFDPSLSFVIETKVTGKSTSTDFRIRSELGDGKSFETSVMDARGGGLVAIVAFLLRVVIMITTVPEDKRFLVLDEVFAHVSADFLGGLSSFLRTLVDETGVQIIMVTHQDELIEDADLVYRVGLKDGKSVFKEVGA